MVMQEMHMVHRDLILAQAESEPEAVIQSPCQGISYCKWEEAVYCYRIDPPYRRAEEQDIYKCKEDSVQEDRVYLKER